MNAVTKVTAQAPLKLIAKDDQSNHRILIVDDDESMREWLRLRLLKLGYTDVRSVDNAEDALEQLADKPADILLLDWMMPGFDGLRMTTELRMLDQAMAHYTAIVMVSAKQDPKDLLIAFQEGVDDYIEKTTLNNRNLNGSILEPRLYNAGRIADTRNQLLRAHQQLQQLATTDPLTDLPNRRSLADHLQQVLRNTSQHGTSACVALIDLDFFKVVNDSYGHAIGDEVLVAFAQRLQRAIRPNDLVARYGGEEFAVVLQQDEPVDDKGLQTFNRIHHKLTSDPIRTSAAVIRQTCSIGVAYVGPDCENENPEYWLGVADRRLYAAKHGGRNRVAI